MEFIVIAMASDKTSDNLNVIYTKNIFLGFVINCVTVGSSSQVKSKKQK